LHAARGFSGITVINAGQEALKLGRLPIEVLQLDPDTLETLHSWGIHDFKSLATLHHISITKRLGQKGLYLQQLARGQVQRELVPFEPSDHFEESIELEEPVLLLESVAFLLNRLLTQLMVRLKMRSLATDEVQLHCQLEVHSDRHLQSGSSISTVQSHQRTVKLPVATQDEKILLKLLQLDLDAHPPPAPIKKITLKSVPTQIRFGQPDFFQACALDPAKLEVTIANLRAVAGEKDHHDRNQVGFSEVADSYKSDSVEVLPFPAARKRSNENSPTMPKFALRRFRCLKQTMVELEHEMPSAMSFGAKKKRVLNRSGPWHSGGTWWDKTGEWNRDIWDVELGSSGAKRWYRILRDYQSAKWFIEGVYD
jgi:protein ImuB